MSDCNCRCTICEAVVPTICTSCYNSDVAAIERRESDLEAEVERLKAQVIELRGMMSTDAGTILALQAENKRWIKAIAENSYDMSCYCTSAEVCHICAAKRIHEAEAIGDE